MGIMDNIFKLFSPYEKMAFAYEEKGYIDYVLYGLGFLLIVAIFAVPIYFIFIR